MHGGYRPSEYWEQRLSAHFSLAGVGHICFSERYNRWLYRAKRRALRRALSFHGMDIRGKAVCDVGCGTGFFVDFYRCKKAADLVGIDITGVSVENLGRRYSEYHFICSDISSPSLVGKVHRDFDIVNALDILYHIKEGEAFRRAIANISALCKGGGYIFISDLFSDHEREETIHVTFRSRGQYEEALRDNGVEVAGVHPLYFLLNRLTVGTSESALICRMGRMIDILCAPLYYILDGILLSEKRSNLKLLIARKKTL